MKYYCLIFVVLLIKYDFGDHSVQANDLFITADNTLVLYIDGVLKTGLPYYNSYCVADTVALPASTSITIATNATNVNTSFIGILASDSDGSLWTNETWKCINSVDLPTADEQTWMNPGYDDSFWYTALREDLNDGITWCFVANISGQAWWITAPSNSDAIGQTALCRATLGTVATTSAPTTTRAPAYDAKPEPYLALTMNGSFTTTYPLDIDCSTQYRDSFRDSYDQVIFDANNDIESGDLCAYTNGLQLQDGDVTMVATETGAAVYFSTVVYPANREVFGNVEQCSYEVADFLDNPSNWPNPIIKDMNGCPSATLDPYLFVIAAQKWRTFS